MVTFGFEAPPVTITSRDEFLSVKAEAAFLGDTWRVSPVASAVLAGIVGRALETAGLLLRDTETSGFAAPACFTDAATWLTPRTKVLPSFRIPWPPALIIVRWFIVRFVERRTESVAIARSAVMKGFPSPCTRPENSDTASIKTTTCTNNTNIVVMYIFADATAKSLKLGRSQSRTINGDRTAPI